MRKSQLSKAKQDRLIEHFVAEAGAGAGAWAWAWASARCAAGLVGVNPKTAMYYFHRLRKIIAYYLDQEADTFFSEEIEVSESNFGGKRKEKRGRGTAGKVLVLGLLERRGKV